jgi:hypothetical protein
MSGRIQNGSLSHEHYSSSPSKTLRAKMGFSFRPTGGGQRTKEWRSESRAGNTDGSPRSAAKAKEKPAGVKPVAC